MSTNDSFLDLMSRLKTGDDAAAQDVFVRFAGRLVGLARKHLDARLAQKMDPEDLVQSAYKSFFVRQRDGAFEIGSWDGLWGLLTVITLRKCADKAEHFGAQRRALSRETPGGGNDSAPALWQHAVDREPSAHEAAVLAETVEALMRATPGEDERAVLELSLQGYSCVEISERLGRAERSVRRIRERIGDRISRMQAQ